MSSISGEIEYVKRIIKRKRAEIIVHENGIKSAEQLIQVIPENTNIVIENDTAVIYYPDWPITVIAGWDYENSLPWDNSIWTHHYRRGPLKLEIYSKEKYKETV